MFDLAQPYFVGMPHHPSHPPYLFGLTKQHGDMLTPAGHSSAADAIAMGSHVGTHIDGFGHFSCGGTLHGGVPVDGNQSYQAGMGFTTFQGIRSVVMHDNDSKSVYRSIQNPKPPTRLGPTCFDHAGSLV